MFSFWIKWRNMKCKVWAIFSLFSFCTKQEKKLHGLSCITQLRIPVNTLQPFFLGSKNPWGEPQLLLHFCSRVELELEKRIGRWFSEGRRCHICMENGGWSSTKTTTVAVSDDWQKFGGEPGGFYAHGTLNKPRKTRGFCIRRTSKNIECTDCSMQNSILNPSAALLDELRTPRPSTCFVSWPSFLQANADTSLPMSRGRPTPVL